MLHSFGFGPGIDTKGGRFEYHSVSHCIINNLRALHLN